MTNHPLFAEKEQVIGHVTTASGSLLITDGIWDSSNIHESQKKLIDLNEETQLNIPITTVIQGGRRYILLAIDAAQQVSLIEGKVEITEKAMKESDKNNDAPKR